MMTQEQEERLQQIVKDVKANWAKRQNKDTVVKVMRRKRQPSPQNQKALKNQRELAGLLPKTPKPQLLTEDQLLPLIEAKKSSKQILLTKYKKCTQCGSADNLTIEHIIPVATLKLFGIRRMASLNYEKHKKNLTVLCLACNNRKGDKIDLSDKKVKRILLWYIKNYEDLCKV